jgi:hypothetical protein
MRSKGDLRPLGENNQTKRFCVNEGFNANRMPSFSLTLDAQLNAALSLFHQALPC